MTHPKFDEVWQVNAYQELTRQSRAKPARSQPATEGLREAAEDAIRLACNAAGPTLGHSGRYDDCRQTLCVRLRAALAATEPAK